MSCSAKMLADSTQSDDGWRRQVRTVYRSKNCAQRPTGRTRRDSSYSSSSSSDSQTDSSSDSRSGSRCRRRSRSVSDRSQSDGFDSDIDLQKEVKPLSEYVKHPAILLEEMFHSVRGSSLKRALPGILKSMPIDELKSRCLQHLEVLSRKRIRRILQGDDPATISSSGTEDDDTSDAEGGDAGERRCFTGERGLANGSGYAKAEVRLLPHAIRTSVGYVAMGEELAVPFVQGKRALFPLLSTDGSYDGQFSTKRRQTGTKTEQMDLSEKEEGELIEERDIYDAASCETVRGCAGVRSVSEVLFPELEQDKMDLLELEMRARAIKAMLALNELREREQKGEVRKM